MKVRVNYSPDKITVLGFHRWFPTRWDQGIPFFHAACGTGTLECDCVKFTWESESS